VATKAEKQESKRARLELPPGKGEELLGLVLLTLAVLLAVSLVSYHPRDPSLLHASSEPGRVRNLIGPVGAQGAALAFGLLGLPALLLPVLLALSGWRSLRHGRSERSPLRLVGALVVLASLPALLQETVGAISWRGWLFDTGGAFGKMLGEVLQTRLNLAGTVLVLVAVVLIGTALAIQTTLGEVLRKWRERFATGWGRLRLARERRRERRSKEKSRRRVVAKHLQRVLEEKQARSEDPAAPGAAAAEAGPAEPPRLAGRPVADLPLRVVERKGEGGFAVRRAAGPRRPSSSSSSSTSPAAARRARRPSTCSPRARSRPAWMKTSWCASAS